MNREQLFAAAQTVVYLSDYFQELKSQALAIYDPRAVSAKGYITPSQELQVRHLQLSYSKARTALLELIAEIRHDAQAPERATPQQFLVALAAATLLIDAARFMRESFHHVAVVRRKLDEPDPIYGIPPRMYDDIQTSLTEPHHAWHLWQATRYFDRHRELLLGAAMADGLEPLVQIIDRLHDRLRPSLWAYVRTRFRVTSRRATRHVGRDVLGSGVYAVQEAVSRGLAHVTVRLGHVPSLPVKIRREVAALLQPGDVLVVRKEFAATNYFLPGYWPHVALYIGTDRDLADYGIANHDHVQSRLSQLTFATATTAVLTPSAADSWCDHSPHPCVLESMKDGVRIRSLNSPFNSDSIVIVRPLLERPQIAAALVQALMHEGKPYDFDFDFCCSQRMVCTEVVYRAYEGIGNMQFDLQRHAGRFALAAGDILRMALAHQHFKLLCIYSPAHSPNLESGAAAAEIAHRMEGNPEKIQNQ